MKRSFKAVLTVLFTAVLAFNLMPVKANAAADNTGYLMYADAAWTYQYWADPVDTGVVPTDVTITGPGEYTVGLDFTKTTDGKATGLAFTAIGIKAGETNFPGYFIELESIMVNGEEVEFAKGYTSSDDKIETRLNIYNEWVSAIPEDAHVLDGDVSNVSAIIVDKAAFESVETIYVTFTLYDAEGNAAAEDAAVEETATEETAEATEEAATTDVPKTGVVGLGIVYGLGVLATGAIALKRKDK
jgi:hypothetical protein